MKALKDDFTSTGAKFFFHEEAMRKLQNGRGQPVTSHVMATDLCNHACAFCSVHRREGDVLPLADIIGFLTTLKRYGLKSTILSGGGNPILWKCPKTHVGFDVLVKAIKQLDLEIGLITNGMPLRDYNYYCGTTNHVLRRSWRNVSPQTLDMLTWIRISCSGFDHDEDEVFVPDVDPTKTTLGFSYVFHDIYDEPLDAAHGRVSTVADLLTLGTERLKHKPTRFADERVPRLTEQIGALVKQHSPAYVRLLPNCLEPWHIEDRCRTLQAMANQIDPNVVFVQHKPPAPPKACYLGYVHPVLNTDGYVYPCDSCVLNEEAGHRFNEPWRVCHWRDVADLYEKPLRSLVDPQKLCRGCVFTKSNEILGAVVDGSIAPTEPQGTPQHVNFI